MRTIAALLAITISSASGIALAAQGEMGTGIPNFGMYSDATGMQIVVFSIASPVRPFPAGCTAISLRPATMGLDSYKMALALLTTAKVADRPIRFYAHAERDGGCGVDYVQLD